MALVRCSCVTSLVPHGTRLRLDVILLDPDCAYVVHRVGSLLSEGPVADEGLTAS
ncbi:MAG: hypothetical protein JWN84_2507 [Nocardioides sp.]|nr:hypothetical protein [Nocardioides sp.]